MNVIDLEYISWSIFFDKFLLINDKSWHMIKKIKLNEVFGR